MMNKVTEKMNGKKRYIAGGTVAVGVPVYLLISFFYNMHTTVVATDVQQKNNTKHLEELKKVPVQISSMQKDIENVNGNIDDIKYEQREMRTDIKAIYKAVVK